MNKIVSSSYEPCGNCLISLRMLVKSVCWCSLFNEGIIISCKITRLSTHIFIVRKMFYLNNLDIVRNAFVQAVERIWLI